MIRGSIYAPGLAVAILATLAAAYVSDHYGAPLTLMCLLFGLSMSFLAEDKRLEPGLVIASRTLLRWGIVLVPHASPSPRSFSWAPPPSSPWSPSSPSPWVAAFS